MIGNIRAIYCKGCGIEKTSENTYVRHDKKSDTWLFTPRCKECHKAHMRRHRATEEQYQMRRAYIQDNIEYYRELNRNRRKERQATPEFKISEKMRSRINNALSSNCRRLDRQIQTIGCTPRFLRSYLESKFTEGMTWENRGRTGWHVDHIIPLSAFDLSDPEQHKYCFHYSNLQPLWYRDNILKKDKIPESLQEYKWVQFLKNAS